MSGSKYDSGTDGARNVQYPKPIVNMIVKITPVIMSRLSMLVTPPTCIFFLV